MELLPRVFVTSDNHFFHFNVIRYCNRPFRTYQEMNEFMIQKWNETIKKEDIVIHLGDFAFRGKAKEIKDRLNGTIIIVLGNHDKEYELEKEGFIIVRGSLQIGNLILTHYPLTREEIPTGFINVHGHIHHRESYNGINVSVERTDYKPIELKNLSSL